MGCASRGFDVGARVLCVFAMVGTLIGCERAATPSTAPSTASVAAEPTVAPDTLLESAIDILQSNDRNPQSYHVAAQRLNQYVLKARAEGQTMIEPLGEVTQRVLGARLSPEQLQEISGTQFDSSDSLHVEACFLRRDIVKHVVADARDDLDKAQKIFDWVVRNVQLVPSDPAHPIPLAASVVLLLGRGTEQERAWVFMELLRQAGIDSVLVAAVETESAGARQSYVPLLPAALVDGSFYLFDTTMGLPVPGPAGAGVATLNDILADPGLLAQLDLDAARPYRWRPEQVERLILLFESSPHYWAPRMRFLQERLSGENRAQLWSHFADLYSRVRGAAPERMDLDLWSMPRSVDEVARTLEYRNQLIGHREQLIGVLTPYQFFNISDARIAQLRGVWSDAIPVYMGNRIALVEWMHVPRNRTGFEAVALNALPRGAGHAELQQIGAEVGTKIEGLYGRIREDCTYFLGVTKFEQQEYGPSANWMGRSYLEKYPEGRWTAGAYYHLGRCAEAQGDMASAIDFYTRDRSSPQAHGNLIRARSLGWQPDAPSESTR